MQNGLAPDRLRCHVQGDIKYNGSTDSSQYRKLIRLVQEDVSSLYPWLLPWQMSDTHIALLCLGRTRTLAHSLWLKRFRSHVTSRRLKARQTDTTTLRMLRPIIRFDLV